MKSLSSKTYQCGVTIQGLTTLSGTVYLTGITNTASWDHVIVGTTAQGQIYTRTYAQFMGDVATGISLSSYVTGSGTTNYLPKFTGGSALGNSQIFDNGTNVGIGTTSPTTLFHIHSTTADTILNVKSTVGQGQIRLDGAATDWSELNYFKAGTRTFGISVQHSVDKLFIHGASEVNNPFITVTNSGNVGIGTTSPSQKLDVNGYAKFTSGIILDGGATSHYREFIWNTSGFNRWDLYVYGAEPGSNVGGDLFLARYADNGAYLANTVTFQRSTGNVGIGTTSPAEKLHVSGNSVGITIDGTTASRTYYNRAGAYIWSTGLRAGDTKFHIYDERSADRFVIDDSGNVGIGTTTPGAKLAISVAVAGTDTEQIRFNRTADGLRYNSIYNKPSSSAGIPSELSFRLSDGVTTTSQATVMTLIGNGNVGIGTTTPSTLLDVSGVITATGGNSTNWNTAYGWGNHASASYVPQARTLTINGTSYDLSANRTWTIATSANIQEAANNGKVTTAASVGTTVITTVATASYDGATFNYVLKDGTNYRAGTIIAVWSAGAVQYNETTTNDIGSTVGVTFTVALNAGNAELRATSATPGWTVKVVTIGI